MHNLDRTQAEMYGGNHEYNEMNEYSGEYQELNGLNEYNEMNEYQGEYQELNEYNEMEYTGHEMEFESQGEYQELNEYNEMEGVFHEAEELELAAELLEVNSEAELQQFIGKLARRAARAARRAIRGPLGGHLGGLLRNVLRRAMPALGGLAGNLLLPGIGGQLGSRLASGAGSMLGLELEGLSNEDREFEVAKQLVRLGGETVKQAVTNPTGPTPQAVVQNALVQAAQQHAPGLIGLNAQPGMRSRRGHSGRWIRRGNKIILFGV
jgi:hypothetical protein